MKKAKYVKVAEKLFSGKTYTPNQLKGFYKVSNPRDLVYKIRHDLEIGVKSTPITTKSGLRTVRYSIE